MKKCSKCQVLKENNLRFFPKDKKVKSGFSSWCRECFKETNAEYRKQGRYAGIYKSWSHMKTRCDNFSYKRYYLWGGRGITYDSRWKKFSEFKKDMGINYKKGLSLDRINNNKGYSKENCRWADQITQNNNRRDNIILFYKKRRYTLSELSRLLKADYNYLYRLIHSPIDKESKKNIMAL